MQFSENAKAELSRRPLVGDACLRSELAAMFKASGRMEIGPSHDIVLSVLVESASVTRRLFGLLKHVLGAHGEILVREDVPLRRSKAFEVRFHSSPDADALRELGVMSGDGDLLRSVPGFLVSSRECARAYLRGAFLARGYVSDPTSSYHLEIGSGSREHAESIRALMRRFSINGSMSERNERATVYLKSAESIAELLRIVGANSAVLEFESVRVVKSVRNAVNRSVNCETANLERTVTAAARQIEDIKLIEEEIGLASLSPPLREAVLLRRSMPLAPVSELCEAANPPITKGAMGNRLRRVSRIAGNLRAESQAVATDGVSM